MTLIPPHGGTLVDLRVDAERASTLKRAAREWHSWELAPSQLADLEQLGTGGFSPLTGFLGEADHEAVTRRLELADGTPWPVSIRLAVSRDLAEHLSVGAQVALRDPEGTMLAVLHVASFYEVAHELCLGGRVEVLHLPNQYDFTALRRTPAQLRAAFEQHGWSRVAAYQTDHALHRRDVAATSRALRADEGLLLHPVVPISPPDDAEHYLRVRLLERARDHHGDRAALALLPLAARPGTRGLLLRAIVAQNHGCARLLVDADWLDLDRLDPVRTDVIAGPDDIEGRDDALFAHAAALDVDIVALPDLRWSPKQRAWVEAPSGEDTFVLTAPDALDRLAHGREVPDWFTWPDVLAEMRRAHPPRAERGLTVFLTGLSGSGKSTVANVLRARLLELGTRTVSLLDGDLVRRSLSSELTFSKEHRDLNVRRIGYVASEITKHGGVAICCPIAPYDESRRANRAAIEETGGGYVLVHIATPLEVCEARDRKGLYAKARAGALTGMTGIDDPYEPPTDADVVIDTTDVSPDEAADVVLDYLHAEGWISAPLTAAAPRPASSPEPQS